MSGLPRPDKPVVATHWGVYRGLADGSLAAYEGDAAPSSIGFGMEQARTSDARIRQPAVRKSFLEKGFAAGGEGRGQEPFIEVSWEEATALVAREIERVRTAYGNSAIYGGSYGWGSAGRFHHAQSQIHRFLNCVGGYTASVQNYSYAAGDVILPYVIGSKRGLISHHTPWRRIAGHTRRLVMFGGIPLKNTQVSAGGVRSHSVPGWLDKCAEAGMSFVLVSPIRDDFPLKHDVDWMAVRPNTDIALMLAASYVLVTEKLHDQAFLDRYTTGADRFIASLTGVNGSVPKTPEWAEDITGISADRIRDFARSLVRERTFITVAWALQRARHGEQVYFAAIALAALIGQIGLPGGGFGFGYGSIGGVGVNGEPLKWPALPQGQNPCRSFIPVARISDMLLDPGGGYDYNGQRLTYPDIRLIYWAGGNPFHHHQDLNRLVRAWKRPQTVVVHEMWWNATARHADIVLPVTTPLERDDLACSSLDALLTPSHKLAEPFAGARTDYDIFSDIAGHLDLRQRFTEGRSAEDWVRRLYDQSREMLAGYQMQTPEFDAFWAGGPIEVPDFSEEADLLAAFRTDPARAPLDTPSGRIELYSEKLASFGYDDCPPTPSWREPGEWLGAERAQTYPLHMISNQPRTKLHSQYDHGENSGTGKTSGRETLRMSPVDAAARQLRDGDVVRLFNDRGACLAGLEVSELLLPGVIQLSTGAWFDPWIEDGSGLELHGNPNVLTEDRGTSRLAQGPSAMTCLVEVERFEETPPAVRIFAQPRFAKRGGTESFGEDGRVS